MIESALSCVAALYRFHLFVATDFVYELLSSTFHLLTLKRLLALSFLYTIIVFCIIWNHIGYALDDIFYPGWRKEPVSDPLFIVGNARSGTTLFHRLVCLDHDNFTSMKTWEIIFASSVTWRYLFWYLYDFDKRYLFGISFRLTKWIDSCLLQGTYGIHPCGLFEAEEDEWVLVHTFTSQLILLFYPVGLQIPKPPKLKSVLLEAIVSFFMSSVGALPDFENALSERSKRSIFQFYKSCVKRHLYAHNHRLTATRPQSQSQSSSQYHRNKLKYVSKNPIFTTRLESLHKCFPDCRVICMVRDPTESVPSMVSYISKVWQLFNCPSVAYPNVNDLIGFCIQHYLQPLKFFNSGDISRDHCKFVYYNLLLKDMPGTVLDSLDAVYVDSSLSCPTTVSQFALALRGYAMQSKTGYCTSHKYSVPECCSGMPVAQLKSLMEEAYDAHPALIDTTVKDKTVT